MGLLSTSTPIGWSAKNSVASLKEKIEGANADLFDKVEWINFGTIDTENIANERESHTTNGRIGAPNDSKHAENRDEQFNRFGGFENDDDENREELRITVEDNTPGDESSKSVVQKWETFIRANHGDENAGNKIELDWTGENSSRVRRKARSVGVLTNKSLNSKLKSERRSFGLGDITNRSVVSKPVRGRRSFGLDDFNADFDKLFPTSVTEQMSSDISKMALQDSISKEKTKQSHHISGNASQDSDESDLKKLISLWNRRSPTEGKRSFSTSPTKKEDVEKDDSNGSGDSRNPDNVSSKDMVDSGSREGDRLTVDNTQPMRAIVILEQPNKLDLVTGEAIQNNAGDEQLVIRNLTRTTESMECECSRSVFSGNEDLISFFLPQMGAGCSCGRNKTKLVKPDDPTALENILRPWQVEFLKSFDIHRGEEFVKARRRSPSILARGLRQWRKKNDMMTFKTTSCATALEIWSKVCKSYVRSIRRQTLAGEENLPADAALAQEMSQFLGDLPMAPKRRAPKDTLAIDTESQFEI